MELKSFHLKKKKTLIIKNCLHRLMQVDVSLNFYNHSEEKEVKCLHKWRRGLGKGSEIVRLGCHWWWWRKKSEGWRLGSKMSETMKILFLCISSLPPCTWWLKDGRKSEKELSVIDKLLSWKWNFPSFCFRWILLKFKQKLDQENWKSSSSWQMNEHFY